MRSRSGPSELQQAVLRSLTTHRESVLSFAADGRLIGLHPSDGNGGAPVPDALAGKRLQDLFPAEVSTRYAAHVQQALDDRRPRTFDYSWTLDDVVCNFECRIIPSGINEVLAVVRDVTRRVGLESRHRDSEAKLRSVLENSPDYIIMLDLEARIQFINRTVPDLTVEQVVGTPIYEYVGPEFRASMRQCFGRVIDSGKPDRYQVTYRNSHDGELLTFECRVGPILREGRVVALTVTSTDVTERVRLERLLRQSQKLEALGQLAGGVAHDFNNLLTAILGHTEMLQGDLDGDTLNPESVAHGLSGVRRAAGRAASLTRQLLAFSRKQVSSPQVLDLNTIVADVEEMVQRLIGEHIELDVRRHETPLHVRADPVQLEQVLLNLVVNARDAMPGGGRLSIRSGRVDVEDRSPASTNLEPGPHATLTVTDDGAGMDAETLVHLFEPFFTTKPVGKGTGLGLSTVYGIVHQASGHIEVESRSGEGSTFTVYLPIADAAPHPEQELPATWRSGGGEIILICEDEASVRDVTCQSLLSAGYGVLECGHGEEALKVAEEFGGRIDLLVTDVVMPGMNGSQLADRLTSRRAELKVLFVSGYSADIISDHGVNLPGTDYLEKPFTPLTLIRRVREILDGRVEGEP